MDGEAWWVLCSRSARDARKFGGACAKTLAREKVWARARKFTTTIHFRDNTMAGPTAVQDAPSTPKDARRKRKAKDSSAGNHDAKRIRTQDEENAAGAPPSGGNQAKAETALAIVGDKAGQLTKAGKNDASKPRKKQHADKSSWYTSEPAGGRFLQIDPIFSRDERYYMGLH